MSILRVSVARSFAILVQPNTNATAQHAAAVSVARSFAILVQLHYAELMDCYRKFQLLGRLLY